MKRHMVPIILSTLVLIPFVAKTAMAEPLLINREQRTFSVSASAEIRVKPDRVSITFGIRNRSKQLKAAKDHMNRVIKDAIAFCKASGILEKHVQTTHISISPKYRDWDREDDEEARGLKLEYYQLDQNLEVTIENLDKYDIIIYGLLDKGINTVENIHFSTTEARKHRDAARLAAVKAAQEKAELLTRAAGIGLGRAIGIQEGSENVFRPWMSRNGGLNFSQNVMQNQAVSGDGSANDGLAPGMVSITAGVTIEYELETLR